MPALTPTLSPGERGSGARDLGRLGGSVSQPARVSPERGSVTRSTFVGLAAGKILAVFGLSLPLRVTDPRSVTSSLRREYSCHRLCCRAVRALGLALSFALAGCVSTPHTTIQGTLNGSPFVIKAPKDGELAGFDLTADTNGVVRVHIDHLTVKMNPDVIGQSGAAQTAIIQAAGETAANITAAAVAAAVKTK